MEKKQTKFHLRHLVSKHIHAPIFIIVIIDGLSVSEEVEQNKETNVVINNANEHQPAIISGEITDEQPKPTGDKTV